MHLRAQGAERAEARGHGRHPVRRPGFALRAQQDDPGPQRHRRRAEGRRGPDVHDRRRPLARRQVRLRLHLRPRARPDQPPELRSPPVQRPVQRRPADRHARGGQPVRRPFRFRGPGTGRGEELCRPVPVQEMSADGQDQQGRTAADRPRRCAGWRHCGWWYQRWRNGHGGMLRVGPARVAVLRPLHPDVVRARPHPGLLRDHGGGIAAPGDHGGKRQCRWRGGGRRYHVREVGADVQPVGRPHLGPRRPRLLRGVVPVGIGIPGSPIRGQAPPVRNDDWIVVRQFHPIGWTRSRFGWWW